jgi:hypothetical protein
MSDQHRAARTLRRVILRTRNSERALRAVRRSLEESSSADAVDLVIALSRLIDDHSLGYLIIPALSKEAAARPDLTNDLRQAVTRRRGSARTRLHLLCALNLAARQRSRYTQTHSDFVIDTALDRKQHVMVRASASRMLSRCIPGRRADALLALATSRKPELIAGVAHNLLTSGRSLIRRPKRIVKHLAQYAQSNPRKAVTIGPLLRLLAGDRSKQARDSLPVVCRAARTREDFARVLSCIGQDCSIELFAAVLGRAATRWSPPLDDVVSRIARSSPSRVHKLFEEGYFKAYLIAAYARRPRNTAIDRSRIRSIATSSSGSLKSMADAMKSRFGLPVRVVGSRVAPASPLTVLRNAYSTGAHKTDALYRDLIIDVGNQNHWHVGIFMGFAFLSGPLLTKHERQFGYLYGINMDGWPGDGMNFFEKSRYLGDPTAQLDIEMKALWDGFLSTLGVDGSHLYHGARRPGTGVTRSQRESVAGLATGLMYQGIWWTWANMLDWKGTGWSGWIDDIDELRCDGVVEYAYEKAGLRACGGIDHSLWNIGAGRKKHPKNHNDFHNGAYDAGELCAKIQAGNQGADTTFTTPAATHPAIRSLQVTTPVVMVFSDRPSLGIIRIDFTVDCAEYPIVYVRLLVRRVGDASSFLVSPETYGWGGLGAEWWGEPVAEGVSHTLYWDGHRDPGGSYFGQNGDYEVIITAIDGGGNVSETCSTTIAIDWSHILPTPW